jgi:hypothetical protein
LKLGNCLLIEAAPSVLPKGVLQRVSVPQATFLTDAYRNSPVKVMVMGQETLGVNRRLADVDETAPNWFEDFYAASETDFDAFDFGFCMNWKRNPFWTAFQEVSDTFELPDRRAVAWFNISKVQLLDTVGNSASINNLNPAERMEVIRWQTALARAEIAYGQPDVIIMFTGRLSWVAKCMFANDSVDQVEAVIERQLLSLPWSTRELVAPGLAGIVTAQTYHPAVWQNLRPKANAERTVMLQWAKQRTAA